jgi:hypothetical protein
MGDFASGLSPSTQPPLVNYFKFHITGFKQNKKKYLVRSPLAAVFLAGEALSSEPVSLACETSLEVRPNSAHLFKHSIASSYLELILQTHARWTSTRGKSLRLFVVVGTADGPAYDG